MAVIQYLTRPALAGVFVPEAARVLTIGGVLLLVFKKGKGIRRTHDRKLGIHRLFRLYEPEDVLSMGRTNHLSPVPLSMESDVPWVEFEDGRGIPHTAILLRKPFHHHPKAVEIRESKSVNSKGEYGLQGAL